jgi:hypothetical protein
MLNIKRLLKIEWWYWLAEKRTRHVELLTGSDISALENIS